MLSGRQPDLREYPTYLRPICGNIVLVSSTLLFVVIKSPEVETIPTDSIVDSVAIVITVGIDIVVNTFSLVVIIVVSIGVVNSVVVLVVVVGVIVVVVVGVVVIVVVVVGNLVVVVDIVVGVVGAAVVQYNCANSPT